MNKTEDLIVTHSLCLWLLSKYNLDQPFTRVFGMCLRVCSAGMLLGAVTFLKPKEDFSPVSISHVHQAKQCAPDPAREWEYLASPYRGDGQAECTTFGRTWYVKRWQWFPPPSWRSTKGSHGNEHTWISSVWVKVQDPPHLCVCVWVVVESKLRTSCVQCKHCTTLLIPNPWLLIWLLTWCWGEGR